MSDTEKSDMRREAEVRKKLRQVKHQYLSRQYKEKLSLRPENCKYYYEHHEIDKETGKEVVVGLCMYGSENPEEWPGTICETIEDCHHFEPKYTKEEVKAEFEESLKDEVVVAHQYKDIAALQWVLDDKVYSWDLAWYQRLHLWLLCLCMRISQYFHKSGMD